MRVSYLMQTLTIIFSILIFPLFVSAQDTYTDDTDSSSDIFAQGCLGAGLCGFVGIFFIIPIVIVVLNFVCIIWIIYDGIKRKPTENMWWILSILLGFFLSGFIGALIWYIMRKKIPMQNPPPGGIQASMYGFPGGYPPYPPQGMYPPPPPGQVPPPPQGQYPPPPPPR